MKFSELAEIFQTIEQESSRTKITVLLADALRQATSQEASAIAYFSLGELQPVYLGTQFNFAEKSMLKVLAHLTGQSQQDLKAQAHSLSDLGAAVAQHNWRNDPTRADDAEPLFRQRGIESIGTASQNDNALTVHQVDMQLKKFLSITGTGSQDIKEKFLEEFLRELDPISAKYIVRIILGKLRLGFSDMTLLDSFSWMQVGDKSIRSCLEDAYNISADIGLIIKTLKEDGLEGIKKMNITTGIPIRPAAAERLASPDAIVKKLGDCVAQPKLDGFRLQVHINKTAAHPKIHFFSRNLQEMSEMFPELRHAVLDLDVQELVAEGEAIAFDAQTGGFLPFQETVKRKRKHQVELFAQDYPLKLYLFDILYLNGKSLLDKGHEERRAALIHVLDTEEIKKHEVIYPIQEVKIKDADTLEHYFEENISLGLEGLVVKRTDAVYQPGKRNFNWIKLKRTEQSGGIQDTLDCVILGYYLGRGKRASFGIGAFLVGIYNEATDTFQTVAKIGTGLTDQEWRDQKKQCDQIKIEKRPANVECAQELYPDIWVSPEIVCLVRADEITRSPLHKAGALDKESGFALRFPRIMGYRPDKSALQATTVKELEHLYKLQFKK